MELDPNNIPVHVAVVMDGNGRWAQTRGLPRMAGHNAGMQTVKEIVKASSKMGIQYLTVYAFSTENWKRPQDEVSGIFKLVVIYMKKELAELHENNVRVKILGDYGELPRDAVESLEHSMELTKNNTGLRFNIAINYGSRMEILNAAKMLAKDLSSGRTREDEVLEEDLERYFYTAGMPDPDLVIRTSGEMRLSNYLLWQCAYSEFVFTDTLWPDFTAGDLQSAVSEYQHRKRRFGGIK